LAGCGVGVGTPWRIVRRAKRMALRLAAAFDTRI
jgi:hypothetical protein